MSDKFKITTITLVLYTKGKFDMVALHKWLPINYNPKLNIKKRGNNKVKVVPDGINDNLVLFVKYRNVRRGLLLNETRAFKHSVSVWVLLKNSAPSLKISEDSIQITGAKDIQDSKYMVDLIINKMKTLKRIRDILTDSDTFNYYLKKEEDGLLDPSNEIEDYLGLISTGVRLSKSESFRETLESIRDYTGNIIDDDIYVSENLTSMLNSNFSLKSSLDLDGMHEHLSKTSHFIPYCPLDSSNLWVFMEYDPTGQDVIVKKKRPEHTFIVYQNGSVTQSGPGVELCKDARDKFISEINKWRSGLE